MSVTFVHALSSASPSAGGGSAQYFHDRRSVGEYGPWRSLVLNSRNKLVGGTDCSMARKIAETKEIDKYKWQKGFRGESRVTNERTEPTGLCQVERSKPNMAFAGQPNNLHNLTGPNSFSIFYDFFATSPGLEAVRKRVQTAL
ncbi:hypothetical protein CPC08DRAFT_770118 [Agrocybe pediades]|nr:hypothetical protein CPC08DRAFT_770118 [Agrocybe pediades]